MIIKRLALDIELTNRCNALCTFCPRDKTPKQGFMSERTFKKAVARAAEENLMIMLTGQGESLIHPQFEEFIEILSASGLPFGLTTNASLLKPERSAHLLASGISRITFSVSDFGEDYQKVYNLDPDNTLANIDSFLAQNNQLPAEQRAGIWISIVEHGENTGKIEPMKAYWRERDVTNIFQYKLINRGGACESSHLFLSRTDKKQEAMQLMAEHGVSTLCNIAFTMPFIGWNGSYYICCSDYEKITPLGDVFQYSLSDMDEVKKKSIHEGNAACLQCNYDPLNSIQEVLLQVDAGNKPARSILNNLALMKEYQAKYPAIYENKNWAVDYNNIIARDSSC